MQPYATALSIFFFALSGCGDADDTSSADPSARAPNGDEVAGAPASVTLGGDTLGAASPASPRPEAQGPTPADGAGAARRPSDPRFEDVVATREGDWVVILAEVDGLHVEAVGGGSAAASVEESPHPDLAEVQRQAWSLDLIPWVVASDELPALQPGRTLVILGPYTSEAADARLEAVQAVAPGARVEPGW